MCGYFCIGFIDIMLKVKILYRIQIYFLLMIKISSITKKMKKAYYVICRKYRKFETT